MRFGRHTACRQWQQVTTQGRMKTSLPRMITRARAHSESVYRLRRHGWAEKLRKRAFHGGTSKSEPAPPRAPCGAHRSQVMVGPLCSLVLRSAAGFLLSEISIQETVRPPSQSLFPADSKRKNSLVNAVLPASDYDITRGQVRGTRLRRR